MAKKKETIEDLLDIIRQKLDTLEDKINDMECDHDHDDEDLDDDIEDEDE